MPVPRQPAHASGCLCARHTPAGSRGTPANQPAARQPAAPYKQLLCESHSNCSVSQRSSGRQQKPCQQPGPRKEMCQNRVQPGQDISSVTQLQMHSVLLFIQQPPIILFLSYRCLELAHSGGDIKLAQCKQHRTVTFALAPPGPAWVWK